MHGAYTCTTVLEKLPVKVECVAAWDTWLLIGTNGGDVIIISRDTQTNNKQQSHFPPPFRSRCNSLFVFFLPFFSFVSGVQKLLVYEVKKRDNSDMLDVRVSDGIKGFGRKAVTQLSVIARCGLMLSLSDGTVSGKGKFGLEFVEGVGMGTSLMLCVGFFVFFLQCTI